MKQIDLSAALKSAQIRVQVLQAFNELSGIDPKMARELAGELASLCGSVQPTRGERTTGSPTRFDRLVEWFLTRKNEPAIKPDIETGLGISPGSLHALLYSEAPENAIETKPNPAGGRHRLISLSPEFFEQAQQAKK